MKLPRSLFCFVLLALAAQFGSAQVSFSTVYSLTLSDPHDGSNQAIAQGRDGNMYITGPIGGDTGNFSCIGGCGGVLSLTPAGVETIIYQMGTNIADGETPQGGVTLGSDGSLYGTTSQSFVVGSGAYGTIYKLTTGGTFTLLYSFGTGAARSPVAAPVQANDGNYYGTTVESGTSGEIYRITSAGVFTTLFTFTASETMGGEGMVLGTDGNLYGASGIFNCGSVWKTTTNGVFTELHNFTSTSTTDGCAPQGVVQAADGNFYGVTGSGGANNDGTIFRVTPNGTFKVLHTFAGTADGIGPAASPIVGSDGALYGTAMGGGANSAGSIWKITTAGVFTKLFDFSTANQAAYSPLSQLAQNTNGNFYGTGYQGGVNAQGGLYELSTGLAPFAKLVTASGKEGAKIGILGQGFSTGSVVKFGGVTATTKTLTGTTFILATVPTGALTGLVTVGTGGTTLTSSTTFRVTPTLTTFTPSSGPVGTVVTINGTGLMQTTAVTFNAKSASFTVVSDSKITATVPTGATTGKIKVTTKGGSVTSTTSFTVN